MVVKKEQLESVSWVSQEHFLGESMPHKQNTQTFLHVIGNVKAVHGELGEGSQSQSES